MVEEIELLRRKLKETLAENAFLRAENSQLRRFDEKIKQSSPPSLPTSPIVYTPKSFSSQVNNKSPVEEKITLFRSLFRGREDVYPKRWESKNNNCGYSPVCSNEWNPLFCEKPRVKCGKCKNRQHVALTDKVIYDHLAGKHTIGVFPILQGDMCWFLAADFDGGDWVEDATAFQETCHDLNVSAALERSRSGNGGHVWIFFDKPLRASLARNLGCSILTQTMERRHHIGLKSYDRFFPNQDTMPQGGFGNLIALPLQKIPRESGNSVFLNNEFQPFPDQWAYLASVQKIKTTTAEKIVAEAIRNNTVLCVKSSNINEEFEEDPWTLPPSGKKPEPAITGPLPEKIILTQGNLLYFEKSSIPPALQSKLIRLAAFQNPEFYKAQAIRKSTYNIARILSCAEDFPKHIGLPRGCLTDVENLLDNLGIEIHVQDDRYTGQPLKVGFKGKMRVQQKPAVKELRQHDIGILNAATAFGKTVVAAKLIAIRKRNTLILVDRRQLLDQWREKLSVFLGIPEKKIGQIGGGKKNITGKLDVATLQSLCRKGIVDDIVADYGHVIVDECHHVAAVSIELLMKKVKAKYILGLTATPVRKDGHQPIIMMQCGAIRYRYSGKDAAAARSFNHVAIARLTGVNIAMDNEQPSLQEIYRELIDHKTRNQVICDDIVDAVKAGRSPLLLTERTDHLYLLAELLKEKVNNIIILKGGMNKKQKNETDERIKNIGNNEERVILATGKYIGEGFDDPRLDTLFLALPISWRGTIQQYAGRLHRDFDGKKEVRIYDYFDEKIPMLARMYKKRVKGYKAIGYNVMAPKEGSRLF